MSHHGHSVTRKTMKTAHGAVHGGRHFRTRDHTLRLAMLLWVAAAPFAGGARDLQDYAPDPAAAQVLADYQRAQDEGFLNQEANLDATRVMADTGRWRERIEELRGDPPVYHYFRARIEYDLFHRLSGTGRAPADALNRALEHIQRFAAQKVRFADGYALHGAILGQKIAANPGSALLHARAAKRATMTALRINPDHQVAHLNLGFTFANAPEAFGGDRKAAVRHFRRAFSGSAAAPRAIAGVWLSIMYHQLGDPRQAAEVIVEVMEFAPGFPLAVATARALADGTDPLVYLERLQHAGE